ncbi:uncharacterized protein [Montipora capricornis]|uniref:uncharacterized protein n=1 Tax=Montipora capricornis TaxID=246305 RepID=UPI0035F1D7C5
MQFMIKPNLIHYRKGISCEVKRLPNHDHTTLVHPDAMHTITNVVTTLVGLLSGNANISQVLLEEEEFGRREWYRDVQTVKGKKTKQGDKAETPVSFCFAPDGIAEANKRASSVTVPVGFGYKLSNIFTSLKMKSYDWLQFLKSNIFKYCILGLLPQPQEATLCRFLDALSMLLREEQSVANLESLDLELNEAMALRILSHALHCDKT